MIRRVDAVYDAHPPLKQPLGLLGEVDGIRLSYLLSPGVNRLGSADSNDIVLPSGGVSRCHALLFAEPDALRLEDLASKNGTRVNGLRVQDAVLEPGDEIEIGQVRLRLEKIDPDDAELAVTVPSPVEGRRPVRRGDTSPFGPTAGPAGRWLALIRRFVECLGDASPDDLAAALDVIVTGLEATGALVVEITEDGEVVVLAARGPVLSGPTARSVTELLDAPGASRLEASIRTRFRDDPAAAVALRCGPHAAPLGLVIEGEYDGRRDSEVLLATLLRLVDRFRPGPAPAARAGRPELRFPAGYVRGVSPAMKGLYRQMELLGLGEVPVLILGETGVGKEYLARILHDSSERRRGPYMALNCAALAADLLEAELFGIGRGVATGVTARPGKLRECDGGTLFLDEVGDMPPELQAKLLRVLQEKEITPVGGSAVSVDVRVLAATNTSLAEKIRSGEFRQDLYYRLAGCVLEVPPLRRRPEDIPGLVEAFIRKCSGQVRRSVRGMTVKALQELLDYGWPGNVRELENEVRRLVCACPEEQPITHALLADTVRLGGPDAGSIERGATARDPWAGRAEEAAAEAPENLDLAAMERRLIRRALERCDGNRTDAARLLGITRYALRRRLQQHGPLGSEGLGGT